MKITAFILITIVIIIHHHHLSGEQPGRESAKALFYEEYLWKGETLLLMKTHEKGIMPPSISKRLEGLTSGVLPH